jgi:hypothetical protein
LGATAQVMLVMEESGLEYGRAVVTDLTVSKANNDK